VVDNSFAPLLLSPARLGADVVVHSLSKFISGSVGALLAPLCCGCAVLGLPQRSVGPLPSPKPFFHTS